MPASRVSREVIQRGKTVQVPVRCEYLRRKGLSKNYNYGCAPNPALPQLRAKVHAEASESSRGCKPRTQEFSEKRPGGGRAVGRIPIPRERRMVETQRGRGRSAARG